MNKSSFILNLNDIPTKSYKMNNRQRTNNNKQILYISSDEEYISEKPPVRTKYKKKKSFATITQSFTDRSSILSWTSDMMQPSSEWSIMNDRFHSTLLKQPHVLLFEYIDNFIFSNESHNLNSVQPQYIRDNQLNNKYNNNQLFQEECRDWISRFPHLRLNGNAIIPSTTFNKTTTTSLPSPTTTISTVASINDMGSTLNSIIPSKSSIKSDKNYDVLQLNENSGAVTFYPVSEHNNSPKPTKYPNDQYPFELSKKLLVEGSPMKFERNNSSNEIIEQSGYLQQLIAKDSSFCTTTRRQKLNIIERLQRDKRNKFLRRSGDNKETDPNEFIQNQIKMKLVAHLWKSIIRSKKFKNFLRQIIKLSKKEIELSKSNISSTNSNCTSNITDATLYSPVNNEPESHLLIEELEDHENINEETHKMSNSMKCDNKSNEKSFSSNLLFNENNLELGTGEKDYNLSREKSFTTSSSFSHATINDTKQSLEATLTITSVQPQERILSAMFMKHNPTVIPVKNSEEIRKKIRPKTAHVRPIIPKMENPNRFHERSDNNFNMRIKPFSARCNQKITELKINKKDESKFVSLPPIENRLTSSKIYLGKESNRASITSVSGIAPPKNNTQETRRKKSKFPTRIPSGTTVEEDSKLGFYKDLGYNRTASINRRPQRPDSPATDINMSKRRTIHKNETLNSQSNISSPNIYLFNIRQIRKTEHKSNVMRIKGKGVFARSKTAYFKSSPKSYDNIHGASQVNRLKSYEHNSITNYQHRRYRSPTNDLTLSDNLKGIQATINSRHKPSTKQSSIHSTNSHNHSHLSLTGHYRQSNNLRQRK
ncbi:hypothetical protein SNEBB_001997 [Seison nebaliae]|nr:hypothetical protein SNEBB_001997 [Seison nebaliae]